MWQSASFVFSKTGFSRETKILQQAYNDAMHMLHICLLLVFQQATLENNLLKFEIFPGEPQFIYAEKNKRNVN